MHNVKNNAQALLASPIDDVITTMTVDEDNFPDTPFYVTLENEIVEVTAKSGVDFTITRACDGTIASAHILGTEVKLMVVADLIRELQTEKVNKAGDTITGNLTIQGKFAEGYNTTASGAYSHAEGYSTTALGGQSHAEGMGTTSSGAMSHAEGFGTTASGNISHAEGQSTTASGWYSHVQNLGTTAQGYAQTVIGKYNVPEGSASSAELFDPVFIIGNGTDANNRSNALSVLWTGDTYIARNLTVDGLVTSRGNQLIDSTDTRLAELTPVGGTDIVSGTYLRPTLESHNNTSVAQLPTISITGKTVVNLLGKEGNLELMGRWNTDGVSGGLTLDANVKLFGYSSGKIDNTGGTTEKISDNNAPLYIVGKYVVAGVYAKAISGTPTIEMLLMGRDSGGNYSSGHVASHFTVDTTWKKYFFKANLTASPASYHTVRLDMNTFGTANDVANFDGVFVYEITEEEYNDPNYEPPDFVEAVQHLRFPTMRRQGANILPNFNDPAWNIPSSAIVTDTDTVQFTSNGSEYVYLALNVKKNTNYIVAIGELSGTDSFRLRIVDIALTILAETTGIDTKVLSFNSQDQSSIFVMLNNIGTASDTQTVRNLTLGEVAETMVIPEVLASEDTVEVKNGKAVITKLWEKNMVLDGRLSWAFGSDYTGFKHVSISLNNALNATNLITKYDGKIIPRNGTLTTGADIADINSGFLCITIADTDSGWGESYSPTADEIKAYFYGWKMNNGTFGANYDGTGIKTWIPIGDTDNVNVVTIVPISASSTIKGGTIEYYKLHYKLADPEIYETSPLGGISLSEGQNNIEITSGYVVKEVVTPKQKFTNTGIISATSAPNNRQVGAYTGAHSTMMVQTIISPAFEVKPTTISIWMDTVSSTTDQPLVFNIYRVNGDGSVDTTTSYGTYSYPAGNYGSSGGNRTGTIANVQTLSANQTYALSFYSNSTTGNYRIFCNDSGTYPDGGMRLGDPMPTTDSSSDIWFYFKYEENPPDALWYFINRTEEDRMSYDVKEFIRVYRDGIKDPHWGTQESSTFGKQRMYCLPDYFDQSSVYTVDYVVSPEIYNNQHQTVVLRDNGSLRDVIDEAVAYTSKRTGDVAKEIGTVQNSIELINKHLSSGDTQWIPVSYATNWQHYETGQFSWIGGQYRKLRNGIVVLRGLVKSTSSSAGQTIFTLPVGYRPSYQLLLTAMSNISICRIDIYTDGRVVYSAGGTPTTWVSLFGLSFLAEQ